MRLIILLLFYSLIVTGCNSDSKKVDKKQQVMSLQNMSDLATAEYVVTKIIKASDDKTWYKAGDRKILMSCKASIVAGIDLSKLSEDDISIDGDNITINLPRAKLLYMNIKPEDIKTAYEDVSMFRTKFTSQEKNELAVQAENQIKESVQSLGVLTTAETNASIFIDNFLKNLGYKNINIHFSTSTKSLQ
ncbi:MAG: DUF4230 domain-containing protein [Ginsengibacter sp.]|jgi:hypothetical protein